MYDLVAWGAQALLLNGQIIRSLTLDNPKPKKSRTGDPYKKIPLGLAGHPLTSLVFFYFAQGRMQLSTKANKSFYHQKYQES